MKNIYRKTRLVLACMSLLGGLFRLLAALVDVASNYLANDAEMDTSLSAKAWPVGIRSYR